MENVSKRKTMHRPPLPPWIRVSIHPDGNRKDVDSILEEYGLNTVCRGARCPNIGECWHRRTATFMILGDACTRNCSFCAVPHNPSPPIPEDDEPARLAEAARKMRLSHAVVTSVTRDDLPDRGANAFAGVIREIREKTPECTIEVLTPDFGGEEKLLDIVIAAGPDIFNHNIETVRRISPVVRSGAEHDRSLWVLRTAAEKATGKMMVKSGLMAGLGETDEEVEQAIEELFENGARMLTVGQYLPPSAENHPLDRYVEPRCFDRWKDFAEKTGFLSVASAPLVRSSYNAEKFMVEVWNR